MLIGFTLYRLLQEVFGKSVNIVYYLTYSDLFAVFYFILISVTNTDKD